MKRIQLNRSGLSKEAINAIASETLQTGGFDHSRDGLPPIGTKVPDGTIYAGVSPDTGKPMYTTPADAPLALSFDEAADYASKLEAHGHDDWRLPSKAELNVLFNHFAVISGFDVSDSFPASSYYWSSTQIAEQAAWAQRFRGGHQSNHGKHSRSSVRCVRCGR